ncbi:MAG: hypothetical protein BLITH_0611 [Brockia lithotrophica]|uniref:Uncharacterized protein n=1 Tax=Brockia lithotrophica TaxID=933949 RepID=A0A2T5G8B4_9BACL|nr:hypothetical protein [Brockia lithotrophica]MBT9252729.1 hypothetical protein [Brockia lithotrophica]PTQ52432.1 MAG: hypothetical protein BLITH_0611 [Brockia lithotrophica]
MGGYIVYRFSGVSEVLEQRFSTLKLAMRKAYLDWTYRRFLPLAIEVPGGPSFDVEAMRDFWRKEGWPTEGQGFWKGGAPRGALQWEG